MTSSLINALGFGVPTKDVTVQGVAKPARSRQGSGSPSLPAVQDALINALMTGRSESGVDLPQDAITLASLFGVDPASIPEPSYQAPTKPATEELAQAIPALVQAASQQQQAQVQPLPPTPPGIVPATVAPQRDIEAERHQQESAINEQSLINGLSSLLGGFNGSNGTTAGRLADALEGAEKGQDRRFSQAAKNYELAAGQNDTEAGRSAQHYQQELGAYNAGQNATLRDALNDIRQQQANTAATTAKNKSLQNAITSVEATDGTPAQKLELLRAQAHANPQAFSGLTESDFKALASRTPLKLQALMQTSEAAVTRAEAILKREGDYATYVKNLGQHYHETEANARQRIEIDREALDYLYKYRYDALAQSGDQADQRMAMALNRARGVIGGTDTQAIRELTPLISQAGKLDAQILQYKKALYGVYKGITEEEGATSGQQMIIGSATESIRKAQEEQAKIVQRIEDRQAAIDARAVTNATSGAARAAGTAPSGVKGAQGAGAGRSGAPSLGDRARELKNRALGLGPMKIPPPGFLGSTSRNKTNGTKVEVIAPPTTKPTAVDASEPVGLTPAQADVRRRILEHLNATAR